MSALDSVSSGGGVKRGVDRGRVPMRGGGIDDTGAAGISDVVVIVAIAWNTGTGRVRFFARLWMDGGIKSVHGKF